MKAEPTTVVAEPVVQDAAAVTEGDSQEDTKIKRVTLISQIQEFLCTEEGRTSVFFNIRVLKEKGIGFAVCNDQRYYAQAKRNSFGGRRGGYKNHNSPGQQFKKIKGLLCKQVLEKYGCDLSDREANNDESIANSIASLTVWPAVEKVKECFNAEFKTTMETDVNHTVAIFVDGDKKAEMTGTGDKTVTEHQAAVQFLNNPEFTMKYVHSFKPADKVPQVTDPKDFKTNLESYCSALNLTAPIMEETDGAWNCTVQISATGKSTVDDAAADVLFSLQNIAGINMAQKHKEAQMQARKEREEKKDTNRQQNKEKKKTPQKKGPAKRKNTDNTKKTPEKVAKVEANTGEGWTVMANTAKPAAKAAKINGNKTMDCTESNLNEALGANSGMNVVSKLNFMSQLTKINLNWSFTPNVGSDGKAFACTVNHDKATATAQAGTKKDAKQEASDRMVKILASQYNWVDLKSAKKTK